MLIPGERGAPADLRFGLGRSLSRLCLPRWNRGAPLEPWADRFQSPTRLIETVPQPR